MNCLPDHGEPGQDAGEHAVRHGVLAAAEEGTSGLLQLPLEGVQGRVKGNLLSGREDQIADLNIRDVMV